MRYFNHKLIGFFIMGMAVMACTDEYDCNLQVDKPVNVALSEYLNQFDVLKSYVDRSTSFQLAANVPASEFAKKSNVFSTVITNFDAVDIHGSFTPLNMLSVDEYDFGPMKTAASTAADAGVALYGGALCSTQGQRAEYLNKLIEPEVIHHESVYDELIFADFEEDNLGTLYPSVQKFGDDRILIEVVNDPETSNGNVLQVGPKKEVSEYHLPMFNVKLPAGKTLGDMSGITLDAYWDSKGSNADMRVYFLPPGWTNRDQYRYQTFTLSSMVANVKDEWVRKSIISIQGEGGACSFTISDNIKNLTEFQIAIGPCTHTPYFYLDNIGFTWKVVDGGVEIIEKTPEEKKEIFTWEMKKWIGGMVYAGVNDISSVKTWNIVSEPLDKTVDANTFNWGEYLGEVEYVRTAVKIANDTVKNSNVNLELFVSNTFNQYDDMGQKADELIALVNSWEADNVTKIDGYNILLHAVYSEDAMFQEGNEQVITELFSRLAQTGKQVRISDLSMMVEDADGNFISSDKLTTVQRTAAAGYMAFIMKEYRKTIAQDKQYGISISGIIETANGNKLSPWTPAYNRNEMYEGIVNGLSDN